MYYFLAIVKKEDVAEGSIIPSYILCKTHTDSQTRSGWYVVKKDSPLADMNKLLVTSMTGNDLMIDFLSCYRTRDHRHDDEKVSIGERKKYYPEGALFWFQCNVYGERDGPAVYIKRVPDKEVTKKTDAGFRILKEKLQTPKTLMQIFSEEPLCIDVPSSHIKPRTYGI